MKVNCPIILVGGSSSFEMARKCLHCAEDHLDLRGEVPHAAVVTTASDDNPDIIAEISGYLDDLPCTYDIILTVRETPSADELCERLERADVIYVPGGSEERIRRVWSENGADRALFDIAERGNVLLVGSSAGAMAFSHACPFVTPDGGTEIFRGWGLVPVWYTPHYQMEEYRLGFDGGLAAQSDPPLAFASGDDAGVLRTPDGRFFTFFGGEGNPVWKYVFEDGEWRGTEFPQQPYDREIG